MAKQNAVLALKESIRLLEIRQDEEGKILKEQFRITYESLKPINLIKSSLSELVSSVEIKTSIFETMVAIVSGYISQKFILSPKSGIFKKIVGTMMQFGVTSLISKNGLDIRQFFNSLVERFISPPEEDEIPETEV